jgi:hypothetical protein
MSPRHPASQTTASYSTQSTKQGTDVSTFWRGTSPRRRGVTAGLVAALIGVAAGGYLVGSALAGSGPRVAVAFRASSPQAIASEPRNPTTSPGRDSTFAESGTFTISNVTPPALYPGTSQPLDLTFTNPASSAITIQPAGLTSSNIALTTSSPARCAASKNFTVSQGLTASVTIPANQSTPISLQSLGVPQDDWPVVAMINTSRNQDACEGATLTLTYSGIEASGS